MGETAEAEFCIYGVSWAQYDTHLLAKATVEDGVFFISRILI